MRRLPIFLAAVAAGAAVAGTAQDRAADPPSRAEADYTRLIAGKVAGKPVSCIDTRFTRPTLSAYGDKLIYRVSRKLVYVNETTGGCQAVARDDVLITRQYQTRLCRGDIAQTADRQTGFPNGGCALGDFTPYTAP